MRQKVKAALDAAHATRRKNLLALTGTKRYPTQSALALGLHVTEGYLSQLLGEKPKRRISERTAREFEVSLGLAKDSLDWE